MAVSIEGVDYSYDRPGVTELKNAGKHFVVRYITTPGSGNKGIDKAEFDALHAAGIAVVVVYEGAAGDMKKGYAQGVADAKAAQANLKGINGLDDYLPVYFACDWDATPGDQVAINDYLDGAASVLGRDRVGIYGGYYPVMRAKNAKKASWFWQTYAWSGGQILAGIHLYQYKNGVVIGQGAGQGTVDLCRAMQDEYGQHGVRPPAPKPVPAPAPAPAPAVVVVDETAKIAEANTGFDPAGFKGIYYFKGVDKGDIFVYDPIAGTKRHITPSEWDIVKGFKHDLVYVIAQKDADKVPTAS